MGGPLVIDARGLRCPLPVLKAEKALDAMTSEIDLEILADDVVARIDIPLLARKRGLACLIEKREDGYCFHLTGVGEA
jgi:tRNA 2-thiouridine synthesizing protein A